MPSSLLTGLIVTVVAIVAAAGVGLARRARDGRVRGGPVGDGRVGDGSVRTGHPDSSSTGIDAGGAVPDADGWPRRLGAPAGAVTLLQFSAEVCGPCRVASRRCAELVADFDGVRHLEVDAAEHVAAARALGVWRTPTILIVDTDGRVAGRASGVPHAGELRDAVAALLPAAKR